ncbi:MAG: tetratricopeptide repeat protein [Deltaproteobacteria bacterium]|jgi:tetratricopeptide (TPR) repeat protein|nr:tetratricopeptide repeat protein [Deltaproteobacteria bacterium]
MENMPAHELISMAEKEFRNGRSDIAIAILGKILSSEPGHIKAVMTFGVIQHSLGDFAKAAEAFKSVLKRDQDNLEALRNLSLTLISSGEYDQARSHLERLVSVNQNDAQLWTWLARLEKACGRPEVALAHAKRSILLNPNQAEVLAFIKTLEAASESDKSGGPTACLKPVRRLIFLCPPQRQDESEALTSALSKRVDLTKVVSLKPEAYIEAAASKEALWLEGASDFAVTILNRPQSEGGRRIFINLSAEDILSEDYKGLNYEPVTDLIFESLYFRDLFLAAKPSGLKSGLRLHEVPFAVDVSRFQYRPSGRVKIAAPGPHGLLSNPLSLLDLFERVYSEGRDLELHLSGPFVGPALEAALAFRLSYSPAAEKVFIHPPFKSLVDFLKDKDFIFASPLAAGSSSLVKALILGLRPLVRDAPGLRQTLPSRCLWREYSEFIELIEQGPTGEEFSELLKAKHDSVIVAKSLFKIFSL